jgi:hypothetical protein
LALGFELIPRETRCAALNPELDIEGVADQMTSTNRQQVARDIRIFQKRCSTR